MALAMASHVAKAKEANRISLLVSVLSRPKRESENKNSLRRWHLLTNVNLCLEA